MYKFVLFDLDGTLTDPALGITNSLIYGLKKWGIEGEYMGIGNCILGYAATEADEKPRLPHRIVKID